MTKTEAKVLNCIENGYSKLNLSSENEIVLSTENEFKILITRDTITLLDEKEVVVHFDRGYIQLSQIVPLISEIVEPYE